MTIYRAILPKRDPFRGIIAKTAGLDQEMKAFGRAGLQILKTYPPKRSSYKRTGELSRHWSLHGPFMSGGNLSMDFVNNMDYAVWVQGPRRASGKKQRTLFKKYGWTSVTDVRTKIWPIYRLLIMQKLGITKGFGSFRSFT